MIRVPVYSLAFGAIGFAIGLFLGSVEISLNLAAIGAAGGYVLWLRARLTSIRAGKPFHLGSAVNVVVCTAIVSFVVSAILVESIFGKDVVPPLAVFAAILLFTAAMVWLHWRTARAVGTTKIFPTVGEVAREAWNTATADSLGVAAAHAVKDVAVDMVKKAKDNK